MFYYEWLQQDWKSIFMGGAPGEPLIPNMHECPPAFAPDVARVMLETCIATGMPVSQRIKARIRLGLDEQESQGKGA